jgi:hypothetical protein
MKIFVPIPELYRDFAISPPNKFKRAFYQPGLAAKALPDQEGRACADEEKR